MFRRAIIAVSIGAALVAATGCTSKKVSNPIANVDSKQPDKVLFDRAMDAMKHEKFDVARVTLQTLINTYPDSEYIARAKLAIGDAWYAEGGSAAMSQAENEYKDFQTFFPNMPEAAEAQMKIAKIHYDEMEKADRDYTHAKRAEEEYRQMILQYPDSKLIPQAKKRLLEVQEVLAEREFAIGRFYFLREDYPAGIARLKTLTDTYPLFSGADQALYMLGEAYQAQAERIRKAPSARVVDGKPVPGLTEAQKATFIKQWEKSAADAYSKIVSRYPAMGRAEAAKKKLAELHYPVPTPTPEAVAQNKAEQKSPSHQTKKQEAFGIMSHHPDVSEAAKVGEPTMVDPPITSAVGIVQSANAALAPKPGEAPKAGGAVGSTGTGGVSIETTGTGPAPENQPVPRSDNGATGSTAVAPVETGTPTPTAPSTSGGASSTTTVNPAAPAGATDNSAQPAGTSNTNTAPAPAPARVNDANSSSSGSQSDSANAQSTSSTSDSSPTSSQDSSSKKKKKKGLAKLNPF